MSGSASETSFTLLSRGDRVRGRLWKPARPRTASGRDPGLARRRRAQARSSSRRARSGPRARRWSRSTCRCAARGAAARSRRRRSSACARDLETQTRADLDALLAHLAARPRARPRAVSLFGVGRSAELCARLAADPRLAQVRLEPAAREPDPGWLR